MIVHSRSFSLFTRTCHIVLCGYINQASLIYCKYVDWYFKRKQFLEIPEKEKLLGTLLLFIETLLRKPITTQLFSGHIYFASKLKTCKPSGKWPDKSSCNINPGSRTSYSTTTTKRKLLAWVAMVTSNWQLFKIATIIGSPQVEFLIGASVTIRVSQTRSRSAS